MGSPARHRARDLVNPEWIPYIGSGVICENIAPEYLIASIRIIVSTRNLLPQLLYTGQDGGKILSL